MEVCTAELSFSPDGRNADILTFSSRPYSILARHPPPSNHRTARRADRNPTRVFPILILISKIQRAKFTHARAPLFGAQWAGRLCRGRLTRKRCEPQNTDAHPVRGCTDTPRSRSMRNGHLDRTGPQTSRWVLSTSTVYLLCSSQCLICLICVAGFASETAAFILECAEDENDEVVRATRRLRDAVENVSGKIDGL